MSVCHWCNSPLEGESGHCVRCYYKHTRPCPNCMRQGRDGHYRPMKKGKPPKEVKCGVCNGQRFILVDDSGALVH